MKMSDKIYIFGHKNPDTDSICSSLIKERFNRKKGYTKCLTRNEAADVLGDGWNIDIITYLFSGLLNYRKINGV